ncbi:MAG: hypothetical protein NWQ40_04395 [Schleiferiaceae bacterium]|nr:hypothetical protein [Schleiferiaceae bacterium]
MAPIQLYAKLTSRMNPFRPYLTRLARTLSLAPARRHQIPIGLPKLSLGQLRYIHHSAGLAIQSAL